MIPELRNLSYEECCLTTQDIRQLTGTDSGTRLLVYLSTASTVLGLVLAILLNAVLVLDRQMFLLNIWLYLKNWEKLTLC